MALYRSNMGALLWLVMLFWLGTRTIKAELFDEFIEDIIETWQIQLPTIIGEEYVQEVCWTQERVLCATNAMNTNELAEHLNMMHLNRTQVQDGLIFVGNAGNKKLYDLLSMLAPSLFTSDLPVFVPLEYVEHVNLRLDSNVVFYEKTSSTNYELFDVFTVKGGPMIRLELGNWSQDNGFIFQNSMNRWDRRSDLGGVTFLNSILDNGFFSHILRDDANNINGSSGFFQDILYDITEKVNLTVNTTEIPHEPWEMLENGSWTGGIGILQRNEVDIVSLGLGQTSQRCSVIDCPMSTLRDPLTLIAAKPQGSNVHPWVYVQVFGVVEWTIFFVLLTSLVITAILFNTYGGEEPQQHKLSDSTLKAIGNAYLFVIQLGDHANVRTLGMQFLALTSSMLTLLMFVHYTNDITAKMTSGKNEIPIWTFDDVIHHDYKVIVQTSYYKNILAAAENGSAKYQVYKKDIENGRLRDWTEAMDEIISDHKTLWYNQKSGIISSPNLVTTAKEKLKKVVALKMDDSGYSLTGFGLQKESEFLKMFNHYLLKEREHGIFNRLYRKYFIDLYVNEEFGMIEPQALGFDNVMFTFACLGAGVTISMIIAIAEFMFRRKVHNQRPINKCPMIIR